jgi:hypothetical protein
MAHGVQYVNQDIGYMSKKHYCPDCKCELKKVNVSKIINSGSEEAKNMPKMFSKTRIGIRGIQFRSYRYVGDIEYIWKEFDCENCKRHFTVEEMKEIEGISSPEVQERSPEEIKKIKIKKLIFNKILPIAILILIGIIYKLVFEK